ncbi:MAG: hypothetical protein GY830_03790 [Bacteroidetes bacterium]|nr:hypothetical protein [Bacteroidota bacterium]
MYYIKKINLVILLLLISCQGFSTLKMQNEHSRKKKKIRKKANPTHHIMISEEIVPKEKIKVEKDIHNPRYSGYGFPAFCNHNTIKSDSFEKFLNTSSTPIPSEVTLNELYLKNNLSSLPSTDNFMRKSKSINKPIRLDSQDSDFKNEMELGLLSDSSSDHDEINNLKKQKKKNKRKKKKKRTKEKKKLEKKIENIIEEKSDSEDFSNKPIKIVYLQTSSNLSNIEAAGLTNYPENNLDIKKHTIELSLLEYEGDVFIDEDYIEENETIEDSNTNIDNDNQTLNTNENDTIIPAINKTIDEYGIKKKKKKCFICFCCKK